MVVVACPKCGAKNRVDEGRAGSQRPVCGRCRAPLGQAGGEDRPVAVDDGSFDQMLREAGDRPVLVDFWAPWCGPCRMLAPALEELAAESRGRWVVAKLNVDENPASAARFNVSSIPLLIVFKNGRPVDQAVGLLPKRALEEKLQAHAP